MRHEEAGHRHADLAGFGHSDVIPLHALAVRRQDAAVEDVEPRRLWRRWTLGVDWRDEAGRRNDQAWKDHQ